MPNPTASPRRLVPHEPVAQVIDARHVRVLDLMGVEIQYLTEPAVEDDLPCIMRGTIPPGVVVPLHAHDDPETLLQLSEEMEGLSMSGDGFEWVRVRPGDVFHVPGGARHALRNLSPTPSVAFLTTTSKMGRFFSEVGMPAGDGAVPPEPPSQATIQHFLTTAARYGHWNATQEENTMIGISI